MLQVHLPTLHQLDVDVTGRKEPKGLSGRWRPRLVDPVNDLVAPPNWCHDSGGPGPGANNAQAPFLFFPSLQGFEFQIEIRRNVM